MISLVVPAYRQETRIAQDVERIHAILETLGMPFEVIVVVDGAVDGTRRAAEAAAAALAHARVLAYERNHGKGYAVRHGMRIARGEVIGFVDSGGDLDPEGLRDAVRVMAKGEADVVVGSKRHPDSVVHYPRRRRVYSAVYQLLAWLLFGFSVRDTQAGLKLFRREVVQRALPLLSVDRYAFDVELLAVARLLGYKRFVETPITVHLEFGSSVGLGSIASMLRDTALVFYRARVARTYTRRSDRARAVTRASA
jgi:glycosyltransferase involved in cell wall biosynthesis